MPKYKVKWNGEKGNYCLYHGNLSVDENEKAAIWLIENIFDDSDIPFVLAGKKPSDNLKHIISNKKNICLIEDPDDTAMQELIKKAQVNILPSFNSTGIKLKLINALFNGRHCLVNSAGVEGTNLECCCTIANSKEAMKEALLKLYDQCYTMYQFEHRQEHLNSIFDNTLNAKKMIGWIYGGA